MERYKTKRIATALAIAGAATVFTGCGSNNAVPTVPVVGSVAGLAAGGCIPINTPQIGFSGTGIYFDGTNIVGGYLPNSGTPVGQVMVGSGGVTGIYNRTGSDGTISMNIQAGTTLAPGTLPYAGYAPGAYGYGAMPSNSTVQGFVTLSSLVQSNIVAQFGAYSTTGTAVPGYPPGVVPGSGYGYPYGPSYPYGTATGIPTCVSGIAFNMSEFEGQLIGNVYLYINNTAHGFIMDF